MRRIVAVFTAVVFLLSLGLGSALASETTGEKWKKEKYDKIDKEAAGKKQQARDDVESSGKWGYDSTQKQKDKAKKIKEADKKIEDEAKQKKKEVDETYKQLGPAKDKPSQGKK